MNRPPRYPGGNGAGGQPQQRQVAITPPLADIGALVLRTASGFARRHKVISGSYLVGLTALLCLVLLGSGTKLTLDQKRSYERIMNTIDLDAEYRASQDYHSAMGSYRATKGWFSCDALCQRNKRRMEDTKWTLDGIRAEGAAVTSDAKKVAGLFSEVGVGEVQDSFWEYFAGGKRFAKRQSWWDALFMGMRSMGRDESMAEYLLRVLMQVLINFTMGLIAALAIFVFGLWSIVKSYQPDPLTAVLFFVLAACAGFAFVSTYLLALYGAAAGGVYGLAKVAESNSQRIQAEGGRGGGRRYVRDGHVNPTMGGGGRPHYQ